MNKVLMISYHFPPMGGSGVHRSVKFSKYLPEFGWEPVILTVKEYQREEMDYSLLDEVPESVEIYRTLSFEPYRLFSRFINKRKYNNDLQTGDINQKNSTEVSLKQRTIRFTKDFVDSLFIPDREIGWLPFALFEAIRILKTESVDVIYSTSDPFTDHLIGYFLKKISGKPWVADFRDHWTDFFFYKKPFRFREKLNQWVEKSIVFNANMVVVAGSPLRDYFLRQYPKINMDKIIVINNGYDSEDFESIVIPKIQNKKLTITYVGRFSTEKNRNINIFKAIRLLFEKLPEIKKHIQMIFIGLFSHADQEYVDNLGLQEVVDILGYQSHKKSIEHMLLSDILLLTVAEREGMEGMYTAKMFEYLAAKKPILALIPECPAATLIRKLNAGIIVPPSDEPAIRKAIHDYYETWLNGTLVIENQKSLLQYERRTLTGSLAKCLNDICGKNKTDGVLRR